MIGFSKSNSELPPATDSDVLNFNDKLDQVMEQNIGVPMDQNSFETNGMILE
jgi:hypothetical protein